MCAGPTAGPMTFARLDSGHFQIGPTARDLLARYVQNTRAKSEAGGVLLGRHLVETPDVIVDGATAPLPGDCRWRQRFWRSRAPHQAQIDQVWRESGGTCTYLGEWHTHPEAMPIPSAIDWAEWQRKLQSDRFTEPLFFVIVGVWEIRVWEGWRSGQLVPLRRL